LFLLLAIYVFEGYSLFVFYKEGGVSLPDTFGNFERVRELLANDEQREEFSFAVVGDTKGYGTLGYGTFEEISEELKEQSLSFMVVLGDCVRWPTPGYHRYLRAEWAGDEEFALAFPVFYAVGNHDVHREKFPLSEFEKFYGPSIFTFDYQKNLFIVLRVLSGEYSNDESVEFLESVLSEKRKDYERIFVFMHTPVSVSSYHSVKYADGSERLRSLFDRFNVDYVIAGDYHGYFRQKINNTVYIVTGGGGAELEKSQFGSFHHAVILTVTPESVSEEILFVDRKEDFEDFLECVALAEVYPWLKEHTALATLLNVSILAFCFLISHSLFRSRRNARKHNRQ